jgi:hypothetical protein
MLLLLLLRLLLLIFHLMVLQQHLRHSCAAVLMSATQLCPLEQHTHAQYGRGVLITLVTLQQATPQTCCAV